MNTKTLALGAAFMASVSLVPTAFAGDQSFGAQPLDAGYTTLAGKDGEGKCGAEGQCGAGKKDKQHKHKDGDHKDGDKKDAAPEDSKEKA